MKKINDLMSAHRVECAACAGSVRLGMSGKFFHDVGTEHADIATIAREVRCPVKDCEVFVRNGEIIHEMSSNFHKEK